MKKRMITEKEKLLKETYDRFIQISLSDLSMEGMEEFVDPKIMGYGTTLDEKVLTIDDYRKLVNRQREQGKDIKMTFDTTPVNHRIAENGNSALFVDEILFSIHIENNPIEMLLRISTVLEYRKEKWVVIHWHGSKPEYEEGETDTWHISEWKNKTEKLERLVEEKTTDLEIKNRELEIEASLERVRAVAMSILKTNELMNVAIILHKEIKLLGFTDVRNTMINIFNDEKEKFLNYDYSDYGISGINEVSYNSHPLNKKFVDKMRKVDKAFMMTELTGNDLDEWRKWRISEGQMPDSKLDQVNSIYYYEYSIDKGAIGISTFEPITEEQLEILQRFRNVFNLAYQHFSDLKKAEEQAREAQIELSLERIRAQAMAMKESADLLDIVVIMRSEFVSLGHEAHYFWHMRWLPKMYEKAMTSGDGTRVGMVMDLPRGFHENAAMIEWEKNDEPVAVFPYDVEGAIDYVDKMIKTGDFHKIDHNAPGPDDIRAIGGLTFIMARTTHGEIGYSLPGVVTDPPAEDLATLVRFAGAFDLAYRRFEDLKEAEAQAREAKIEAALERVRSKAMAMHSSDDMTSAVSTVFSEIDKLGFKTVRCGIGIFNDASRNVDAWTASSSFIHLSGDEVLEGHPLLDGIYDAWQNQHDFSYVLKGKDLIDYYNVIADSNLPLSCPEVKVENVTQFYHVVIFPAGGLYAFRENEFTDEAKSLMKRFADVFHLAFTRHLDLKQAEAQAREAQIEASLERVRSRTMAMHKSNELAGTAANLFEQLSSLGIKPYRCNIAIVDTELNQCQIWSTTNKGNVITLNSSVPLDEYSVSKDMYDGWKSQKSGHIIKLAGEELLSWTKYIKKYVHHDEYKTKKIDENNLLSEIAIFSMCYFRQGFFLIHTKEEISGKDFNIIQRFANVFEQTYTRFLDLENAELQNKIIQAENERKTQELEEARQLQLAMLPKELPQLANLDIAVYMQTATEVGGDYYDFNVDDNGTLTAVVGDATGHGMKAGTIVTITKSLFNSLGSKPNILKTFKKISHVIKDMKFRQLSMCLMMLKITDQNLLLSSAAMPPALIYRKSEKSVEEIVSNGMPLGAMINFPYKLEETKVKTGDTIFLMSDGFPELMNEKKGMYGYERVKNEFLSIAEKSPNEIIDSLKNSASDWVNGNDPDDDVTFVVIKVK